MVTSSSGNIFRATGHLCGEFTGYRYITHTMASDAELWCFLDLRLNKRLSKQWWGWWFETPSRPLWRQRNGLVCKKTTIVTSWPGKWFPHYLVLLVDERPVMRGFDFFFYDMIYTLLNKQSSYRWFETSKCSYDVTSECLTRRNIVVILTNTHKRSFKYLWAVSNNTIYAHAQ